MPRRFLAPTAFLFCLAVLVSVDPRDVNSLGGKSRPRDLDMSPMGRIAAGLDPVPDVTRIPEAQLFRAPSRVLGPGGSDVLTHSPLAADFQSETTIAKNGDWIVVGFNDVRGFAYTDPRVSGYAYSHDNGVTWTDGGQLPTAGNGDDIFGDPDVKTWTDPNTDPPTVYFVYSSIYITPAGIQSMCVHVSTDGGVTWSPPRNVTPATIAGSSADKEFIDIDPETGRLFISWTNFPSAGTRTIKTAYSDNFGLTWSAATSFTSASGQGSVPRCAGNSDNVYIVWTTGGTIQYTRSTNNGATWGVGGSSNISIATGLSTPMNPYGSDRIHNMPSMDVDPGNGNIYVTYASRNLPPDFADVYMLRSTDGGTTFSSPVAINSSPGNDRAQFFPAVAADEADGSVSVIWYDQRAGTGTSDLTELVHTHSTDGGVSWTCPTALSDAPFHAEAGNRTSQPNIGDYQQCVSHAGILYSCFGKTDFQSWTTYSPDAYVDVSTGAGEGPAPLAFVGFTITDEGCTSNNGHIEPGETISLTATIRNAGGCGGTGNVLATLATTTPGVSITTASATFPGMPFAGSTSANTTPFEFTVDPGVACGTKIDFRIDYNVVLFGPGSLPFEGTVYVGHPVATVLLSENFDGVVPPVLPGIPGNGWSSATLAGTLSPWQTSTTFAASGPNSVFCADIASTGHNELQSPPIVVPAGTEIVRVELDETHNNELDIERRAWDGVVMRILLGGTRYFSGGAGNMTPFYPWQMNRATSATNPLHDLACWSGNTTPNFAHYSTDFPDLGGQSFNLVFGMSTDPSVGTATGQFIDNVVVTAIDYQCDCTDPPILAVSPSGVSFGNVPVNTTDCDTLLITNNGATDLVISSITGCDTSPFTLDTSGTSFLLTPGQSTTLIVCVTPTGAGSPSCNVTIASNDPNGPAIVPVSVDNVTAAGASPRAFDRVTVVPNPFNPETSIRFTLPSKTTVTAEIWSVDGARVRTLARDRSFGPGTAELRWNGMDDHGVAVASGIYFVRVKSPLGEHIARAVLLK